jgi:hypothetical protein
VVNSDEERIKPWLCALCKKRYVVPDLARMCEQKHLEKEYS